MLCGKPVLASVNPGNDLIEFLHRADAGIACANGDDCGLRSATLLLATNPEVRKRMGMNAHALASTTFSVQTIAEQIISHFCQRERQQPNARAQSAHGATSGVH
jgi:O26-antigen biosynthesis N-acetyl-L-fucosamine transferase